MSKNEVESTQVTAPTHGVLLSSLLTLVQAMSTYVFEDTVRTLAPIFLQSTTLLSQKADYKKT